MGKKKYKVIYRSCVLGKTCRHNDLDDTFSINRYRDFKTNCKKFKTFDEAVEFVHNKFKQKYQILKEIDAVIEVPFDACDFKSLLAVTDGVSPLDDITVYFDIYIKK